MNEKYDRVQELRNQGHDLFTAKELALGEEKYNAVTGDGQAQRALRIMIVDLFTLTRVSGGNYGMKAANDRTELGNSLRDQYTTGNVRHPREEDDENNTEGA